MSLSKPLTLVDVRPEPKLTGRQAFALGVLRDAGADGLTPVVLGAALHDWSGTHPSGRVCEWCHSAGSDVLRALRKKGLARQRRPRGLPSYWQATDLPVEAIGGEIPF